MSPPASDSPSVSTRPQVLRGHTRKTLVSQLIRKVLWRTPVARLCPPVPSREFVTHRLRIVGDLLLKPVNVDMMNHSTAAPQRNVRLSSALPLSSHSAQLAPQVRKEAARS